LSRNSLHLFSDQLFFHMRKSRGRETTYSRNTNLRTCHQIGRSGGLTSVAQQEIGPDSNEVGQPSPDLVRIVYGLEKFEGRAGLHLLADGGQNLKFEDRIEYMPLGHPECLPGALYLFRGVFFILHLGKGGLAPNAEMMLPGPLTFGAMATGGVNVKPMFHQRAMKFAIQNKLSHVISFSWS
jgi:hypothetical protein